jgi:hypothetical protein
VTHIVSSSPTGDMIEKIQFIFIEEVLNGCAAYATATVHDSR